MRVTERDGYCRLERYEGNDRSVVLPEKVNGKSLTVIGTKAFLSCRSIEQLVLPRTVDRIEDWAFAHMKNLKEIVLPVKDIFLGKKVFLGCRNLKSVKFSGIEGIYEGIPCFLASMVTLMEGRPVGLELAGSSEGQWKWLEEYDAALLQYLDREDIYGFEPAFIGWFNVEDVDDQQQDFVRERRKCKISLAFQRLFCRAGMSRETEKELSTYDRFRKKYCSFHNIQNYFRDETDIHYEGEYYSFHYENRKLTLSRNDSKNFVRPQIIYIPAERNLLSALEGIEKVKKLPSSLSFLMNEYINALRSIEGSEVDMKLSMIN